MESESALDLIREFDQVLEDLVGLYLDAEAAMVAYADKIRAAQEQSSRSLNMTVAQLDSLPYSYGRGDPCDPHSLHLHTVTQGGVKERNAKGGKNHVLLGQRFIVDIYTYWEDAYRSKIAEALDVDRSKIVADILGDIRHLRNSIVHHRGIALPEVDKCKILKWFATGDVIQLTPTRFETIVVETRNWLEAFGKEQAGSSPKLAGRFGPTGHRHLGPE